MTGMPDLFNYQNIQVWLNHRIHLARTYLKPMPLLVAHAAAGLTKSYKFLYLFYHFYKVLFLGIFIREVLIRPIFERKKSFRNGNMCFDE